MPLPDAEPGKNSNLYRQLRSSQVSTLDQESFDQVLDPIFVNDEWEDEARRLKLWGEVSGKLSSSGPLIGTGVIKQQSFSAGTTGWATVWRPDEGEIWQVQSATVSPVSSGDVNLSMSYYSTESNLRALLDAGTGTVTADTLIDMINGPTFISNDLYLQVYIGTNVSGVAIKLVVHRVR